MRTRPSPITARARSGSLAAGQIPPIAHQAWAAARQRQHERKRDGKGHERNSLVYCVSCRSEHQSSSGVAVPTSSSAATTIAASGGRVHGAFQGGQRELAVGLAERHGAQRRPRSGWR